MALWFECSVRYDKMMENGSVKKVTEPYLVDALSFTDAEARVIEKVTPFISGEFAVSAEKKTKISEIFFDQSDYADKYWMVKVNFITLNEKTGKEKKSATFFSFKQEILKTHWVVSKMEWRERWRTIRLHQSLRLR